MDQVFAFQLLSVLRPRGARLRGRADGLPVGRGRFHDPAPSSYACQQKCQTILLQSDYVTPPEISGAWWSI